MSTDVKKIVVSDRFVDIYKNFNVLSQVDNMNKLTERELYLLLFVCLDKHTDDDPVVNHNYFPFENQIMEILDVLEDRGTTNKTILDLIDETGESYIETDGIVDSNGESLPDPLTKDQVRDAKISKISDENID